MDKAARKEIRDAFKAFVGKNFPAKAQSIMLATDLELKAKLQSSQIGALSPTDEIYDINDIDVVEEWRKKFRGDPVWRRIAGESSDVFAHALRAYRHFLEDMEHQAAKSLSKPHQAASNIDYPEPGAAHDKSNHTILLSPGVSVMEGDASQITLTRYERSKIARKLCIESHFPRYSCAVCGFNFAEEYGEREGEQYIEVHHVKGHADQSEKNGEHPVDYVNDLVPLCANCHRMAHYLKKGKTLTPSKLKEIWERRHHERKR